MSNKAISVYATALKRQQAEERQAAQSTTSESTRESTQEGETLRDNPREKAREPLRDNPRDNLREKVREPSRESPRESSRDNPHEKPRETSRDLPRGKSRDLPTRDDIQEFSFRLRDELKIKVQAEVPHQWQKELDEIARQLDVKKLELYRYILGEFLGKVRRKNPA